MLQRLLNTEPKNVGMALKCHSNSSTVMPKY